MALVDELTKLHALQQVDTQIYQREQTLKALDTGEKLKQEAIALLKAHDAAQAALRKADGTLIDANLALKSLEDKRKAVHDKLYSGKVTNPKELADLERDEQMIDGQISRAEEVALERMDEAEAARTTDSDVAARLSVAKRSWQQTVAHFQAEAKRLQGELAVLRPQRQTRAAVVDKPLLRRYDDIRQRREGIGMAVTGNDTCPICHIKLDANIMMQIKLGEVIMQCENCGCILMWQR